jgi:hypothetical protein
VSGPPMINLIPASRLKARRGASRVRLWLAVIPACSALFAGAWVINWLGWSTDLGPLTAELEATKLRIKQSKTVLAGHGKELREAEAKLRANRAVGEQPDWSILLEVLAAKLGTDAGLKACILEPVAAAATPGAKSKEGSGHGRPEELKLTLKGVADTQAAVSKFVLGLEATGAFDLVQLVETNRDKGSDEGIGFEVVCRLTDPGGSLK